MKNTDLMKKLGVDNPVGPKEKFGVYPLPSGQAVADDGKKYPSVLEALKHTLSEQDYQAYGLDDYHDKQSGEALGPVRKHSKLPATTALEIPGKEIDDIVDVVGAEVVYGHNFFKELATELRDLVGGRSVSIQKTLSAARKEALAELKESAGDLGADAIIAVQFTYANIGGGAGSVSPLVAATGTAVRLAQ